MLSAEVGPPPIPELPAPWRIRVAEPHGADLALVHRWMHVPHVVAGYDQAWDVDRWAAELAGHLAGQRCRPCIVSDGENPFAYLELYRVRRDRLAPRYPFLPYDLGVHIAIGEPDRIGRGVGQALLRAVADGLLAAEPECRRVVAEPDVRNAASVGAFTGAGFVRVGEVTFPHKTSALLVRPREPADLPELAEQR